MSVVTNSGEELQLLKKVRGSLELDYDVLHSVLTHPSIGDRPISIVSIAGAFRSGKSFMLNFFLRYLRNKGYENPNDWLGDPSSSFLKDGIEWRGGRQANTCGISIWSEPFIVKKGEKEIAVILLDTQGNSDHSDSRKNDVKVFVISVLLSSTFIYNIKSQIDSKDLESLQYFMEFAKARKDSESMKARFQFLWFLVRDWETDEDYSLGEKGGEEYLKTVLDTKDESSLKKYLRKAFETVNCYLMPNPGKLVRQAKNESSVTLADIEPECLQHISQFTECLLNPESLVVKEIDGDVVNGRWLAGYIADCWKKLKKGGLPSKDTMMEFFMEFAKAKEDSERKKARFQFLWFLIRDWEYKIDHSLGEKGGEEYLKTVLDTKDESSLKKYLRQAFEAVNCYLMPNPGKRVRRAKSESSITVNDVEPECLEHILHFTECLLNPGSLAVKIIEGDVVNGRWLAGYIADCWKELKDGGLPPKDTMMELMAQAKCQELIEKCKNKCEEVINNKKKKTRTQEN